MDPRNYSDDCSVYAIDDNVFLICSDTNKCSVGVHPALEFESIDEIISLGCVIVDDKLILCVYEKNALLKNEQIKWTNALVNDELEVCRKYPLDFDDCDTHYNPIKVPIYEYNGKRAIRIKINSSFGGKYFELSNGEKYKDGDYAWFGKKIIFGCLIEKN